MATIRKRQWTNPSGEQRAGWRVSYTDGSGKRRTKQFAAKKEAEAWLTETAHQVAHGIHTPDSQSPTIVQAAERWLARARRDELEPTTIAAYEQHVRLHIIPMCGTVKLSQLNPPLVQDYRSNLLDRLSRPMARKVLRSLGSIVALAHLDGRVAQNACRGISVGTPKRGKLKLVIPSKAEMKAIMNAALASDNPMHAPLMAVEIFTGLRASEIRGLTWQQVDLKAATLAVDRRADATNKMGPPKSRRASASYRCPTSWFPNCASGSLDAHRLSLDSCSPRSARP